MGKASHSGGVVSDACYQSGPCQPGQAARFGLAVQRAALFDLLSQAAAEAGAKMRFGAAIAGAEDRACPRLILRSGAVKEADLIVDALGARSALSPAPARALEYGALWSLLSRQDGDEFQQNWLEQRYDRASRMAGVLPVGRTAAGPTPRLAYFWSLRADRFADWRAVPLSEWKAGARALWPETASLLDQITSHQDMAEVRYIHRTLRTPFIGRIVHVGDSYRPASPQLGQGANMALLDYAARRAVHVRLYQGMSRLLTPLYQSDSVVLPWLRDQVFAPLSVTPPARYVISALVAGTLDASLRLLELDR